MSLLDISECSDLNTQRDPEPMDNVISGINKALTPMQLDNPSSTTCRMLEEGKKIAQRLRGKTKLFLQITL